MDPSIRQQTYQFFLQEAPELLQALEQGLLRFQEDHSIRQVNDLMRATHTLKGAATSVGLDTIASVAHSLEDVFKALCNPEAEIDSEVKALLFEGVECLRIPLAAELAGKTINHDEILDRAIDVFAQLEQKLGDCFGRTAAPPSSAELGFDVIQSMFEVGVAQRLEELAAALTAAPAPEVAALLQIQAEIFLGLAESLNLPGFAAIAQATIAALSNHPDQVIPIAELALADFRRGQSAVLAGDRIQAGEPCLALQQLAGLDSADLALITSDRPNLPPADPDCGQQFDPTGGEAAGEASKALLETIWGGDAQLPDQLEDQPARESADRPAGEPSAAIAVLNPVSTPQTARKLAPTAAPLNPPTSLAARDAGAIHVRVNVKYLEQLNYSVGELLTNHNRQFLQAEQLQSMTQLLLTRLKQHQQGLNQLRDWSNPQPPASKSRKPRGKKAAPPAARSNQSHLNPRHRPLIQSLLDDIVQLSEVADAIELFTNQSVQTLEQQRHLLTTTRSALIEARMQPLGEIFSRLPPMLQQLETLYSKPVRLELHGTEVLVDKVVAEKLYDPLLHLVRNAFDHGIEPAAARQQQQKPEPGSIAIRAHNQGKYLVIEVEDDGKGLDFEQILQRALDRRLVTLEQAMSADRNQLIDLIFETGFSTAAQVNDLSGRGVGLDIVRNQIQALQGSVTVETEPDRGTTFVLKIPLNLTIASLLVFEAGAKVYALLDEAIEQIIIPQSSQIQERNNCRILHHGKEPDTQLVVLYSLNQVLNYSPTAAALVACQAQPMLPEPAIKPVILVRFQGALVGLEVDQLIGEQELVIRPLGMGIAAPAYVHGASILADRRLALVIDGAVLIQTLLDRQWEHQSAEAGPATPRQPGPRLAPAPPQSVLPAAAIEGPSRTKLLVVEDSITTRQTLVLTLQRAGYQVFQAQNGQEALNQLQHQPQVQLVVCDLEMPGVNGFEFLRQMQQNPNRAGIPVLILTSRSDESYQTLALQLGAAAYMTKPYLDHKLLSLIADLLAKPLPTVLPS